MVQVVLSGGGDLDRPHPVSPGYSHQPTTLQRLRGEFVSGTNLLSVWATPTDPSQRLQLPTVEPFAGHPQPPSLNRSATIHPK